MPTSPTVQTAAIALHALPIARNASKIQMGSSSAHLASIKLVLPILFCRNLLPTLTALSLAVTPILFTQSQMTNACLAPQVKLRPISGDSAALTALLVVILA